MAEQIPLTALLSWAWTAFAIEADNAVEAAGTERIRRLFRISMPMWAQRAAVHRRPGHHRG